MYYLIGETGSADLKAIKQANQANHITDASSLAVAVVDPIR